MTEAIKSWHLYNDANNQKAPTTFLHLLIFLIQPYKFRATNSPILRSTFWLYIQLLLQCTDIAADRCHGWEGTDVPSQPWHRCLQQCLCIVPKTVYTVKKCSWGWANLSPETRRAELKRLINEKLLHLVGYLDRCTKMMHGHTDVKFNWRQVAETRFAVENYTLQTKLNQSVT